MLADAQIHDLDLNTLGLVRHARCNWCKGWNAREMGIEEIVPCEVLLYGRWKVVGRGR